MYTSIRITQEQIVGQFLDEHFYPVLFHDWNHRRTHDKMEQVFGMDVELTKDNRRIVIDEKAKVSSVNRLVTHPCLELQFRRRDGEL